jgi:hypothetical protein
MLEFLIDNMLLMFGGCVFQQIVGIHLGTKCAPFLAYFNASVSMLAILARVVFILLICLLALCGE